MARNIVLCSKGRHFTLTVPLFTQAYKWELANVTLRITHRWVSIPFNEGVEILLVTSCSRDRDKLHPAKPLGTYVDLAYLPL